MNVGDRVHFEVNVPFSDMYNLLSKAQYGFHTMWCEHFGIGIVELMAAGLVVIANNSGGPARDIIIPYHGQITGKLATTKEEYADCLLSLSDSNQLLQVLFNLLLLLINQFIYLFIIIIIIIIQFIIIT